MSAAEDTEPLSEEATVFFRRYTEAREFGFNQVDARVFAESGIDVERLRRLKRAGCPPRTAARILL